MGPARPSCHPLCVPGGQGARQTCPAGAGSSLMRGQPCRPPPEGRVPAQLGRPRDCRWRWRCLEDKHPPRQIQRQPGSAPTRHQLAGRAGPPRAPGLPEGPGAQPQRSGPGPGTPTCREKCLPGRDAGALTQADVRSFDRSLVHWPVITSELWNVPCVLENSPAFGGVPGGERAKRAAGRAERGWVCGWSRVRTGGRCVRTRRQGGRGGAAVLHL